MIHFAKIVKGVIIGIAAILPGVSGAVIAAAFNIYKELVVALDGFIKHPIKSIKSIWQYLIGIFIGVLVSYFLISILFKLIPLPITFLFLGLIIGQLPQLISEVKVGKKTASYIITSVISALIMVGVIFLPTVHHDFVGGIRYLIYFLIGIMMALSFIVPGLSGTMLLMALGFYTMFTYIGYDAIEALKNGDSNALLGFIPDIGLLLFGLIFGALVLVKPIHYALRKKPIHFNFAVLGIVIVSPINILLSLRKENLIDMGHDSTITNVFDAQWYVWIVSIVLLSVGFILAYFFIRKKGVVEGNLASETEENQGNI